MAISSTRAHLALFRLGGMTAKQLSRLYIREWRVHRHLTGEQLADLIGSDKGSISAWENGRRRTNTDWLKKLAEAFKCTVPDLYRHPDRVEEEAFLSGLPDDVRAKAIAYAKGLMDGR